MTNLCPFCSQPARHGTRISQVRRGNRVLSVEVEHWECAQGCLDEDGASIFRFEDQDQLRRNDETIRAAWLARFGEAMPPARRPGRKPPEPRDVRVQVLLTASEAAAIDRARGGVPRSEYIRRRLAG
jgi:hypothetical protein